MTTLFRGGEDIDFSVIGGSYGLTNAANVWINPNAGMAYRAGYARCALSPAPAGGAGNNVWLRSRQFSATDFWFTARFGGNSLDYTTLSLPAGTNGLFCFRDAGLVTRLRLKPVHATLTQPFWLQKVSAAGMVTNLAASTSGVSFRPSAPDKIDLRVNYAVSGTCQLYINGTLVLNYSGDLTTDGSTALAFVELGTVAGLGPTNAAENANWSEVIVSTQDTRNQSLVTRAPVALGVTHEWSGAAADVNELRENDATPNLSDTATQVQQYTVNALPSGNFAILDVTQVARVTLGATGPQHVQLGNRTYSADFFSNDIAPTVAWDTYSHTTTVNPSSSVAYTTAELNDAGYNVAMKSTA